MSLIEEALRRAQQAPPSAESPSGAAPSRPPEPPPRSPPSARPAHALNGAWWISLAAGGTLLLILTLWGYAIALRWQAAKISVPAATPQVSTVAKSPEPVQPTVTPPVSDGEPSAGTTVPTLIKRTRPELVLNGVVEGRGEPLAIINGLIVRIGDSVAGATLLEIQGEEARLRWRDEEWLLSTTH